ncbi:sodium-translocating pyrophosphatase [Fontivita pretiosa]|uniref:sodium-translocating pyrophosphatase n=1 Tax=Fontivita pretiosa TaxID=2989684 RepID=UPI003D181335
MLNGIRRTLRRGKVKTGFLVVMACLFAGLYIWQPSLGQLPTAQPAPGGETLQAVSAGGEVEHGGAFKYFSPLRAGSTFSTGEKIALIGSLLTALAALAYAGMLVRQVTGADTGTPKMQAIAAAVREGANAYLARQLKVVAILIVVLVVVLFYSKYVAGGLNATDYAIGRAWAFLMGAVFSATVGFVGMRMATIGNLRVAAAAPVGFGKALMYGYRSGTITGMLTDGLGLLGGTIIFMMYGEHAYEALLGFGFGGTLLALFMRVGGGIYTKAADVGADLVGKIEKDIPEDDPRNAATIADNVGDNVGDCAGMAADIFESYEVTIVAAMILGWASFGHKGVMFPILVRAIGVIGSIISTYTVRAGDKGNVAEAMKQINKGFLIGSVISVVGFIVLGFFYLRFHAGNASEYVLANVNSLPAWANLGIQGLDMRPAWTCLVGIILCIALNRTTEYFTGTEYSPVRGIKRNTETGHGTTIIEGFAVGYESAVWTAVVLCAAIYASVLIYSSTMAELNPIFIAYGVAMCGIGMLTLTGNTVSMDVFGPIADNANGIAEMGYELNDELFRGDERKLKEARQILADLDAVGNTTKAVTKGVAIGSAVIAAVSLYASFITVIGSGGGGEEKPLPLSVFNQVAGLLSVSSPNLLIGMLIGGAVPFMFSSMLIRAVGRAAYLIVNECRIQFRDKEIWAGTKKPDYGKVVSICTGAAQKELVGPAVLGVFTPVLVGYFLGPIGLAGFLGGSIVAGQLLASFMCNAGGAWDNAKKMVEDEPRTPDTGKGSEKHKASVTGDTVGDPLKDTAGPAINPLLKVMNMVAVLGVPLMLAYDLTVVNRVNEAARAANFALAKPLVYHGWDLVRVLVILVAVVLIGWAIWQSKRETGPANAVSPETGGSPVTAK